PGGLNASVAHSGQKIVIALASAIPVGIDVEQIDPRIDIPNLLPHVLAEVEAARLPGSNIPDIAAFYRLWTRKESILKATGDGLRVPLHAVAVSPPDQPPRLLAYEGREQLLDSTQMWDLEPENGYAASVTVLSSEPVQLREFQAASLLKPACRSSGP
ncbi:MAG: 4'-phosphopantetheinyl transferase superfamily protein, partial [Sporichthyaceae bacterium]|nr:4'-phosphopantetheinyl transferase superfamily protein [Sporichthyaceae bacterium]